MNYPLSKAGLAELKTANSKLYDLFIEVADFFNFSILDGVRTVEQQRKNVAAGLSETMHSKHLPGADGKSQAVDAAIYPQHWDDQTSPKMSQWEVDQVYFSGFVMGYAAAKGLKLRYGGDWNSDGRLIGQGFRDIDHFEIVDE